MINDIVSLNVPITLSGMFDSPIEFLLYSALQKSMPDYVLEKAFLMPQVDICDGKYILDIALMERRDPIIDGTEAVPATDFREFVNKKIYPTKG